ncbi:hypothetical protein scyTo_0020249 [Scyliorhinus torazame]|uniref:Uncharacterized protein n=1 Tax=Scyliorhinus torazame TaxID=75743 RepID=A0A401Q349_SCYTO|nr:hypothetical protein [Scyliorhinus torazame]
MAVCVKANPLTNVAAVPEQQAPQTQYLKYCPYVLYSTHYMFQCLYPDELCLHKDPAPVKTPAGAPTADVPPAKLDAVRKVAALAVQRDARTVPMAVCVKANPLTNVAAVPEHQAPQTQYVLYSTHCMFQCLYPDELCSHKVMKSA